MSHVEACQGEVSPTDKVRIPPPPTVPATSIDFSGYTTSWPMERDGAPTSLDILRKVVRDTLNGSSQTTSHPDVGRSYWQNEEKEVTYNGGMTPYWIWERDQHNGIIHTQGMVHGPPEGPDSVDPYEEHHSS